MTRIAGRYAAIDIGTVTCRLLIADVDSQGHLVELYRGYGITNLGEGVDATGLLKPEAMQRVADKISEFLKEVARFQDAVHPHIHLITMATSASRDAKNAGDFIALLDALGVSLTIIPGEREAQLSFEGVAHDFPGEDLLVVDIGGGSTEYSAGHAREQSLSSEGSNETKPLLCESFDVGCRRVTERFLLSDPPSDVELAQARAWARDMMESYFRELTIRGFDIERLVAVAGTATSVVSIRKKMKVYDSSKVHRSVITYSQLEEVYNCLRVMSLQQRRQVVGLDPERAPIIVAGLLILLVAMELSNKESFTTSESDILQGIILQNAENHA